MDTKKILTAILISFAVAGCSSMGTKKAAKPAVNKKTVAEVMRGVKNREKPAYRKNLNKKPNTHKPVGVNYTRTQRNELNGIFPRLPNPDICMYVYPHITSEGSTVPGYTTCFSMYKENHYALPGEMAAVWQ